MTDEENNQQELEHQEMIVQMAQGKPNTALKAYVRACLSLSGKVKKDSTNPHFKSGYASLEAVLDVILPACHEQGLVPLQEIIATDTGIAVKTTIIHDSGDVLELMPCPIPVDKNTAQGVVSASTYGRRVSLMAIFGLAPSDDDGNKATAAPPLPDAAAVEILTSAADEGLEPYRTAWRSLTKEQKKTITPEMQESFKKIVNA